jgi:hypothetical protein
MFIIEFVFISITRLIQTKKIAEINNILPNKTGKD